MVYYYNYATTIAVATQQTFLKVIISQSWHKILVDGCASLESFEHVKRFVRGFHFLRIPRGKKTRNYHSIPCLKKYLLSIYHKINS